MEKITFLKPIFGSLPPHPMKPGRKQRGGDAGFGLEGTNKTVAIPQDDAEPSAGLQGTKSRYIPKSPYTRG